MFEWITDKLKADKPEPAKPVRRPAPPAAGRSQSSKPAPAKTGRPAAQQRPGQSRPKPAPAAASQSPSKPPARGFAEDDDTPRVPPGGTPSRPNSSSLTASPASRPTGRPRVVRRQATEKEIEELRAYEGDVWTAEGAQVATGEAQRKQIAALDDGTLLIAESGQASAAVSSVQTLLEKASYPLRRVLIVDMETVRRVYDGYNRRKGGAGALRDTAKMQRSVIDLVRRAAELRCSDIHIVVRRHEAIIRVRSDGVISKLGELESATAHDLCAAAFNMADASDSTYQPYGYQEARISSLKSDLPPGVQSVRLQFNPIPDSGRYLVMRLLYDQKSDAGHDVDRLGYAVHQIRQIKRMRDKPFGIVIISGPTGSGKSTTLQTALQATAREKNFEVNIITVEDPPEYEINGAQQLPVTNAKSDEERREAMRSAITASLRSDPDIVMIGEIRDGASASLAFQAAMTGHQVWASLHANDAISILDRLRDQKVETYKLSDHTLVAGLIGQRLVRRLCDHCKIGFGEALDRGLLSPEVAQQTIDVLGEDHAREHVHVANRDGCPHCKKGFAGRTVVAETILPDRNFMELLAKGSKVEAYEYWLDQLDGMTMLEHACTKLARGEVEPSEVLAKVGLLDEVDKERVLRLHAQELKLLAGQAQGNPQVTLEKQKDDE